MDDDNSDGPGPSSGFGEVDAGGPFHPQCSLVSMWFGQLGVEGCLLTGKLVMTLSHPQLDVNLSSMDSCLMLLLLGLLLNREELPPWQGYCGPHRDHHDGLECGGVLRHRCSGDGDNRGSHVAPSGSEKSRSLPSALGSAVLIGGILEGGVQRWRPVVRHSYENGA
jgi:hypothetical protein